MDESGSYEIKKPEVIDAIATMKANIAT